MARTSISIGILLISYACASVAQSNSKSSPQIQQIAIEVRDTTGEAIEGARVRVTAPSGQQIAEATTGRDGTVGFSVPDGSYLVSVIHQVFKPWNQEVRMDRPQKIEVRMDVDCDRALCGMIVTSNYDPVEEIPMDLSVENPLVSTVLPLEPLQSLNTLPARTIRHLRRSKPTA